MTQALRKLRASVAGTAARFIIEVQGPDVRVAPGEHGSAAAPPDTRTPRALDTAADAGTSPARATTALDETFTVMRAPQGPDVLVVRPASSSDPLGALRAEPPAAAGAGAAAGPGTDSPTARFAEASPLTSSHDDVAAWRADVAVAGNVTWVFIDGESWAIEVEPAERAARPRASAGPEGLTAPMPATVIRILVEPGRVVKRGETLLLLEAMKMELPVRAPRDGTITALHCEAGQLVQPGVALVDLA